LYIGNRINEVAGGAVLQPERIAAGSNYFTNDVIVARSRHDDDFCAEHFATNPANEFNAVHSGKVEVHYRDLRPKPAQVVHCRLAIGALRHDFESGVALKDCGKAVPAQGIFIGQKNRYFIGCHCDGPTVSCHSNVWKRSNVIFITVRRF
jgi:hypothetical protein